MHMQIERGHIQYSTQSEQTIRLRTNKPTPRNSTYLCTTWGAMGRLNTRRLIMHMLQLHGSSTFGYWLLINSRSGLVITWTQGSF